MGIINQFLNGVNHWKSMAIEIVDFPMFLLKMVIFPWIAWRIFPVTTNQQSSVAIFRRWPSIVSPSFQVPSFISFFHLKLRKRCFQQRMWGLIETYDETNLFHRPIIPTYSIFWGNHELHLQTVQRCCSSDYQSLDWYAQEFHEQPWECQVGELPVRFCRQNGPNLICRCGITDDCGQLIVNSWFELPIWDLFWSWYGFPGISCAFPWKLQ